MEFQPVLVVVLAIGVGLALGLLGGGGSILMVPLLTYAAGMEPREAIAASLFVVGSTSLISALAHTRRGNVRWRTGLVFGGAGMAGAFLGGLAGGRIPGTLLMIAFALMMIATAAAMIRSSGRAPSAGDARGHGDLPLRRIVLDGLIVGAVTGLVGAGGGFLVVPALTLLGGLAMPVAVGTSLLVIAMKSFAGLAGYLTAVDLDWPLVGTVTATAIAGSLVGALLTSRVPEALLRRAFGVLVLAMGVLVLAQELPPPLGAGIAAGAVLLVGLALVCRMIGEYCPLHPLLRAGT
ncbi:sulfite exporter TauE/SafE family protein [Nocardiopsis sp. CC223A]|uniref:sulfite exporter TauE/SafE family protein n=1 Tax=Nocardiopsis sp. CC223A TaxID=3044051 RepID=UPI00278BBA1B|nr:sulfite exporter TauE/SafE family protein [Nocardiopsis sp. CC223A]